jgi:hypothetical protein
MDHPFGSKNYPAFIALWVAVLTQPATLLGSYCWCPVFSESSTHLGPKSEPPCSCSFSIHISPSCHADAAAGVDDTVSAPNEGSPTECAGLPRGCCPPLCPCHLQAATSSEATAPYGGADLGKHFADSDLGGEFVRPLQKRFLSVRWLAESHLSLFGPALLSFLCQWRK